MHRHTLLLILSPWNVCLVFSLFFKSMSCSKVAGSDSQVWNFSPRIPGNQGTNFSLAGRIFWYRQVNQIATLLWTDPYFSMFIWKLHNKLLIIVELPNMTVLVFVDLMFLHVCSVNEWVVPSGLNLIQLLMKPWQKWFPFNFSTLKNQGQGVGIYMHTFTLLCLCMCLGKFGLRYTGGLYRAGSVSVLKSRAMG